MKPTDYINNFRDLGESINLLLGEERLLPNTLYRGGKLTAVLKHTEILNIPTIINLRTGADDKQFDCNYYHFPADNSTDIYHVKNRNNRKWLQDVVHCIINKKTQLPIYIHCTMGKDRTGIIAAAILLACGIDSSLIIEEYSLSQGKLYPQLMKKALEDFGDIEKYLKGNSVKRLREILLSTSQL